MFATVRKYKDLSPGTTEEIERRRADIEAMISRAPGFVSYSLCRTDDGLLSVTVCDDRAGTEESNTLAASWIKENMPGFVPSPPEIWGGEVLAHLARPLLGQETAPGEAAEMH